MIKLNKDTIKAKNWLDSEIQGYKLNDVYDKYSKNKIQAFEACKDLCKDKSGWGLCIISHNCNYFTVKFTVEEGIYILTYANNYFIEL